MDPKTARERPPRTDPNVSPKSVVYTTAFWMGIWPCIGAIHLLTLSDIRVLDFIPLFIGATMLYLGRQLHMTLGAAVTLGLAFVLWFVVFELWIINSKLKKRWQRVSLYFFQSVFSAIQAFFGVVCYRLRHM